MYGRPFYDAVADALTGFLPPSLRNFEWYRTNHNLKLWYGENGREHYEVQIFKKGKDVVLEVGFHAEHKDASANDEAVARLAGAEKTWRKKLGADPEVGSFIGRQTAWRRISEIWGDGSTSQTPDLGDPELAIDAAMRLATYITTFEPLRSP